MYQTIFLGYCCYCKNFGHEAKYCKGHKNEAPRLKDQTNNLHGPIEQGQIKSYNSFDPLAKFDPSCSLFNNYDHNEQNCSLKREEAKRVNFNTDKCGLALCAHSEENHWFVDSGCSRHMTGDQKKFVSLNKKNGNVSFGSGSTKIIGKGAATLVNGQGKAQNTLLVEGLKHNLLSVSQICDQGQNVVFSTKM